MGKRYLSGERLSSLPKRLPHSLYGLLKLQLNYEEPPERVFAARRGIPSGKLDGHQAKLYAHMKFDEYGKVIKDEDIETEQNTKDVKATHHIFENAKRDSTDTRKRSRDEPQYTGIKFSKRPKEGSNEPK